MQEEMGRQLKELEAFGEPQKMFQSKTKKMPKLPSPIPKEPIIVEDLETGEEFEIPEEGQEQAHRRPEVTKGILRASHRKRNKGI